MFAPIITEEDLLAWKQKTRDTISAKVICDSVAPNGCRLTTMEWTYPRFIHSEIMTHRKLSRNSASSRAIPLSKMIERIRSNPVFPIHIGKNQPGMQANEELDLKGQILFGNDWLNSCLTMLGMALCAHDIGVHKQIGNRVVEPWMYITIIASATNFENLFSLRVHKDAEPHFQNLARKVMDAYDASTPRKLRWGEWHLPYINEEDAREVSLVVASDTCSMELAKVSSGKCARVSYLTQDGLRDWRKDVELYDKLVAGLPKHSSPLEHPAQAIEPHPADPTDPHLKGPTDWGNFDPGWLQLRKMIPDENITTRRLFS